jgi:hypothetical protein
MKSLFKILFTLLLVTVFKNSSAQSDTVSATITNFNITNGGTKFSYDMYILRNTPGAFRMGNSSFYITYNANTMNNPVISNVNPKYTVGSISNSYNTPFSIITPSESKVGVQIQYIPSTTGDDISGNPGTFGLGEMICTVTLDIQSATLITLNWNTVDSDVVNPFFVTAYSRYFGSYTGTLPVELSSFTANVNKNNVNLHWQTANESNNRGFEIERKSSDENSQWSKISFVEGNGTTHESRSYSFSDNKLISGKYSYRLKQVDFNGNFEYFNLQNDVNIGVPDQFELSQNYPNPFNPSTKINFSLPVDSKVKLSIYDMSGKLVSTLINNEFKSANYYSLEFNGSNLSSGTYFYTIEAGSNVLTKKMVLIK